MTRNNLCISWRENEENTVLPDAETAESIYSVNVKGTTVSAATRNVDNIPLIYETAIGASGSVAYIVDKDGDAGTRDGVLYVKDNKCHESDEFMTNLHYADSGFCFTDGGSLRKSGGSSSYTRHITKTAHGLTP